jgi:hypothetical protein
MKAPRQIANDRMPAQLLRDAIPCARTAYEGFRLAC